MIIWHPCVSHSVQDRLYGQNGRACNPTDKGSFRCTVCGKEVSKSGSTPMTKRPSK